MDLETILAQFRSYYSSLGLSAEAFMLRCLQENNATVLYAAKQEAETMNEQDAINLIARFSPYFAE